MSPMAEAGSCTLCSKLPGVEGFAGSNPTAGGRASEVYATIKSLGWFCNPFLQGIPPHHQACNLHSTANTFEDAAFLRELLQPGLDESDLLTQV